MNLAQALDSERQRISTELHDRAGPNLATVAINLRTIEQRLPLPASAELFTLLAESQSLLAETIAAIRDVSAELRPTRLDYAGLLPALTERVEQFRQRTGLQVQLNTHLRDRAGVIERLPAPIEWIIFRVVQEALNNTARHAAATQIVIDLMHETQFVTLQIRDDGVGFLAADIARQRPLPGMGLLTMRERVELARGVFLLSSRPGHGTQIRVTLPLPAAAGDLG